MKILKLPSVIFLFGRITPYSQSGSNVTSVTPVTFTTPVTPTRTNIEVYLAGIINKATLCINGEASVLNYCGVGAIAESVFISGSDVYVAVNEIIGLANPTNSGVLWKNWQG